VPGSFPPARGCKLRRLSDFVVGGVVTDLASWRLVFWAYLPLAAALAAAVVCTAPGIRAGTRATGQGVHGCDRGGPTATVETCGT
jgi:hypothetical protein